MSKMERKEITELKKGIPERDKVKMGKPELNAYMRDKYFSKPLPDKDNDLLKEILLILRKIYFEFVIKK